MGMDYYFGKLSKENEVILDADEANHLVNVRRAKTGDLIHVTDGEGNLFVCEVRQVGKHICELSLLEKIKTPRPPYYIHIAIAPTKNIDRIEWFLEKATENGIDEVSFIICRHSERKEIKIERLQRVILAAMKQSQKTFLPKMNPAIDFKKFIITKTPGKKLICSMAAEKHDNLKRNYTAGESIVTLIGPEGDFHSDELSLASQLGYHAISLGNFRLRTETAALNVCTIVNFINAV
jgi:16S rRNA (uracil1498-N3)-methyltransferase